MDPRLITLLAACSMLAACAQPAPVAMPAQMSQFPAPLQSGEMTHPAAPFNDSGAMTPHMSQGGSGVSAPGSVDSPNNAMAIPESSMGTLHRPAQPTP